MAIVLVPVPYLQVKLTTKSIGAIKTLVCTTIRASLTLEFNWISWGLREFNLWDKKIKLSPSISSPRPVFTSLVKKTLTFSNAAKNVVYSIFQSKKAPLSTLKQRRTKSVKVKNEINRSLPPHSPSKPALCLTSPSNSCGSSPWNMSNTSCSRCLTSATPPSLRSSKLRTSSIVSSATYRFTWRTRLSRSICNSGTWLRDSKRPRTCKHCRRSWNKTLCWWWKPWLHPQRINRLTMRGSSSTGIQSSAFWLF